MHGIIQSNADLTTASHIAAGIVASDDTQRLHDLYYPSKAENNVTGELAQSLQDAADQIQDHPELLAFMNELVTIERGALDRAAARGEDVAKLHQKLSHLEQFLYDATHDIELPALEDLPEEHQQLLEILRHHTAQNPFRPVSTVLGLFKKTGEHIVEEAKEQPYAFGTLFTASVGALLFMNARLGNSAAIYIDPKATEVINLSLDAIDNPDHLIQTDNVFYNPNLGPTCHDHLKQLVGEPTADFLKDNLGAAGMFPEHCSRLKTLALDAQSNLQWGYDFVNLRIGLLIKAPAENLGAVVIPDSTFKRGFDVAAHNTAEFIYAANTVENVTLHTAIALTASLIAYKVGTIENEETQETREAIGDFAHRSVLTAPLNYAFATAAMTYSYTSNGGFSPEMVWMGVGGALAGYFTHKALRRRRQSDHVRNATITVDRELAAFSDPVVISCGQRAEETAPKPTWIERLFRNKRKLAIAAGTAGLCAVDIATTGGLYTSYATGGLMVLVPFLGYNVIEDTSAHLVFGIAGGLAGYSTAIAVKSFKSGHDILFQYRKGRSSGHSPGPF